MRSILSHKVSNKYSTSGLDVASKKRFSPLKWVLGGVLFFVFGFLFLYAFAVFLSKVAVIEFFITIMPQTKLQGVNILAFGVDETHYVKRSDTIVVFHLDSDQKRIGVLSIPRDTRVNIPNVGVSKINHAYAKGGTLLLKQSVSDFLSIPIDHSIKINLQGLSKIVDSLGGVQVTVQKDLYYQDQAAGLMIDLKKGKQTLKGNEAMQYLRFRHDSEGDIGRIKRQQNFMQAVASKITHSGKFVELPMTVRRVSQLIETDLSAGQLINLAVQFGQAFKAGGVEKGTVPGAVKLVEGVSYWEPDITKTDALVESVVLGFGHEEEWEDTNFIETPDKEASQEDRRKVTVNEIHRVSSQKELVATTMPNFDIRFEILNGIGHKGEALIAADLFEALNLNVLRFDNAGSFNYDKTVIVDWKGDIDTMVALAAALQIDPDNIIVYDRPEKSLDVTIVLGNDWFQIKEKLESLYMYEKETYVE